MVGDGRAGGWSTVGDGGQAAISLTPTTDDIDGRGSTSLLDSVLSPLSRKRSSDVWVVALFFFSFSSS